jgi:hypothetical protein
VHAPELGRRHGLSLILVVPGTEWVVETELKALRNNENAALTPASHLVPPQRAIQWRSAQFNAWLLSLA